MKTRIEEGSQTAQPAPLEPALSVTTYSSAGHSTETPLQHEPLITMPEAARIARVSANAVARWITRGKNGRRLEGVKLGRALFTSRAALVRFGKPAEPVQAVAGVDPRRAREAMRKFEEACRNISLSPLG